MIGLPRISKVFMISEIDIKKKVIMYFKQKVFNKNADLNLWSIVSKIVSRILMKFCCSYVDWFKFRLKFYFPMILLFQILKLFNFRFFLKESQN